MDKRYFLVAAAALTLFALVTPAHAQSASAVFTGPQNIDAGLQNGLNNLTGYVAVLPFEPNSLEANIIPAIQGEEAGYTGGHLLAGPKFADSEVCR